jgi:tetratricopeptide (TPR) repeat protein
MGQAGNYEALIRELLVGVAGGWSYGKLKRWLKTKNTNERDLILSLHKYVSEPSANAEMRSQLKDLAAFKRGELASIASELGQELDRQQVQELINRGCALFELGRYKEAIASYDIAIKINPENYLAWYNRAVQLAELSMHEQAIYSYKQAIKINHGSSMSYSNMGVELAKLERYEQAIVSYNMAIKIDLKNHVAFFNKGNALDKLGRYKESIYSYENAIKIKLDKHEAWGNKGNVLNKMGQYEEAIISFDRAIHFKPDKHESLVNKGLSLLMLEEYKEAIISFDRAIHFKPDKHEAWGNKGNAFYKLGQYEDAINSYSRTIQIKSDDYLAWDNRGIALVTSGQYKKAIKNYDQAFQHIHYDTHPEGYGFLQHRIGRTYYDEGNKQLPNYRLDNQDYYGQAIASYKEALKTLTRAQFPNLRIETLIDTAKAHLAQNQPSLARERQTEALTIWLELINAQPTPQGKKRLYLEYSYLLRTQVDLSILDSDPIRALEIAEFDKNKHIEWFLYAQEQQGQTASLLLKEIEQLRLNVVGLQYPQMRQLLTPNRAIVYWHLSPDNLTTFILHPHHPNPQVLTNSSQQLKNWLKDYDTDNLDTANWQELGDILKISEINPHLDGIEHLILIPHRDLHRLPLHT